MKTRVKQLIGPAGILPTNVNFYVIRFRTICLYGLVACGWLLTLAMCSSAPADAGAVTATAGKRLLTDAQAGIALLEFNGVSEVRTAVTLAVPMNSSDPVVLCSPSDEWAIGVVVGCQALGSDLIGITARLPYTITHTLEVNWMVVEPTQMLLTGVSSGPVK